MRMIRRVDAFLRSPIVRKRLAFEAAWELLCARILTLRSAAVYSPALGILIDADPEIEPVLHHAEAQEIGHVVTMVGRCLPFRALCLQQVIAVRRMLTRRGIPAVVYLGVARDQADRARADLGRGAHAWVSVGSKVISGDGVLDKYAVVARFA